MSFARPHMAPSRYEHTSEGTHNGLMRRRLGATRQPSALPPRRRDALPPPNRSPIRCGRNCPNPFEPRTRTRLPLSRTPTDALTLARCPNNAFWTIISLVASPDESCNYHPQSLASDKASTQAWKPMTKNGPQHLHRHSTNSSDTNCAKTDLQASRCKLTKLANSLFWLRFRKQTITIH